MGETPDLSGVKRLSESELIASIQRTLEEWGTQGHYYLFGYGSLIWRKEESLLFEEPITLEGFRREFCVWSLVHRGNAENPGLVLGLIPGGTCQGMLMRFASADVKKSFFPVWEREMLTGLYKPVLLNIARGGGTIKILTFVVNTEHPQYTGDIGIERKVDFIRGASGESGNNADYVLNTWECLREMGVFDEEIEKMCALLKPTENVREV